MTLLTVYNALKTTVASIMGNDAHVMADLPAQIQDASCPCVVIRPGPCPWSQATLGQKKQRRVYIIGVYVRPLGLDVPIRAVDHCFPLVEKLAAGLLDDPNLGNSVTGLKITENEMSDGGFSGPVTYPYSGQQFWGFELAVATEYAYT